MSRNRIDMSNYIFDQIHASALAQDPNYSYDGNKRWLARKDEADAELMANAEVEVLALGARVFAVSIRYGADSYFCFSGLAIPDQLSVDLEEAESTPGLFGCVVYCAKLQALGTASQARNILEQQYKGLDGYAGHELTEIAPLFPNIHFVKVRAGISAAYLSKLERVAGAYIAAGYPGSPLEIDSLLRDRLIEFFEAGSDTIPFHLPLQGLLSYSWSSLFLDLYRSLEQLYTALKLKSLVGKISHKGSLAELAYLLEEELSWRPKEQDALASILALASDDTRSKILSAFDYDIAELSDYSSSKCAKSIYKLRNSHVHFRPAMKAEPKTSDQWNRIVMAMCDAVDDVYAVLGFDFLKERSGLLAEY